MRTRWRTSACAGGWPEDRGMEMAVERAIPDPVLDSPQGSCSPENARPCELAVAVGWGLALCHEVGARCEGLEQVYRDGYSDEAEVLAALRELLTAVPEERRVEAQAILCSAFPSEADCYTGSDKEG